MSSRNLMRIRNAARSTVTRVKTGLMTLGARVNPSPIIVLGNQKSGTSAIAALLAEISGLSITLDLRGDITKPVIDRLHTGELSFDKYIADHKLEFSRDIIKEPGLTPFYEQLAEHFPESNFVMVIRDPRDNIRSILNRFDLPGDLDDMSPKQWNSLSRAWRLTFDGSWLGLGGDNYVEKLSHRWNYLADIYLANSDKIIHASYEAFLRDKVGEIRRLASLLGIAERHDIADKVDIQYQPAGNRSVKWDEFFGNNLARVERICADRMTALDYPFTTR